MLGNLNQMMVIAAVAIFVLYNVLSNRGYLPDYVSMSSKFQGSHNTEAPQTDSDEDIYKNNPDVLPHPQMSNDFSPYQSYQSGSGPMGTDLTPEELLPREGGFSDSNPTNPGHLSNKNFFESGHHPGLNTQSGSLKNPNLQLRSDPYIPRRDVGPWGMSTYEPDLNRKQFEIGSV
jgi:hypothetical protein